MKALIYNTKDLFEQYKKLHQQLGTFNSLVQNNMVIEVEEAHEQLKQFTALLSKLEYWGVTVAQHLKNNKISDEEADRLQQILEENQGIIPEKETRVQQNLK